MTNDNVAAALRRKARMAGASYLVTTISGLFGAYGAGDLIVHNDAAATAAGLLAHEALFRQTIVADLLAGTAYVVVTLLLFELLKPVDRSLSMLAAFFSLIGVTLGAVGDLHQLGALAFLGGTQYSQSMAEGQLQALAYASLRISGRGSDLALLYFGVYCLLLGYLIFRSGFLPRFIGVLMAIAGLAYDVNSVLAFLSPSISAALPFPLGIISLVGEAALTLWLLILGVDSQRWIERSVALKAQET